MQQLSKQQHAQKLACRITLRSLPHALPMVSAIAALMRLPAMVVNSPGTPMITCTSSSSRRQLVKCHAAANASACSDYCSAVKCVGQHI
jgi:hypothetical protein